MDDILTKVAETYGVDPNDVTVEIAYEISGTMDVEITGDVSTEDMEESLKDELAELLGTHDSKIEVTIENGIISYTIKSNTTEDAKDIQMALNSESSTAALNDAISKSFPVVISGTNVNDEITADIAVTVDATDASKNLDTAAENITKTMQEDGIVATAKSTKFKKMSVFKSSTIFSWNYQIIITAKKRKQLHILN